MYLIYCRVFGASVDAKLDLLKVINFLTFDLHIFYVFLIALRFCLTFYFNPKLPSHFSPH